MTCNGDMDRAMKVVVRDHNRRGKHYEMGEFETKMQRFVDAQREGSQQDTAFTLRRGDKKTGSVQVLQAAVVIADDTQPSEEAAGEVGTGKKPQVLPLVGSMPAPGKALRPEFVDYLTGGCQISLAVAIDFTASNGKL